ncbi:bifunctional hydroxymethylpyrimidine kinase/phosphomethylpyrimidine kinase [Lederbergia sp. NSJ-179]|uniref:bifunctional hydroxymethylpyrimidine kinase/phosphomethylpyrimidine kinase n=1 Tax=Lederbergia sp. NSJ-179 TaxID=2931402 RepID=UPI001FCF9927|nr:bifunctional hydroxymethylpyrimidine kinase/phosphomethylpyrimidine kinase [Lederbergia sp. NSJ-179]MCJ7841008.1 bifunctional hydroxymethylpyrimidine kinase/phosphomethylpyrimidine kinase [Lederbergia sp. NSJ-179]
MTYVALTIAGSDSGGGAGIQADLKTFQELGVFGTSALTAVTAQNTLGVHGVYPLRATEVTEQVRAVMDDFQVGAVKTGMLFSAEIIGEVAQTLKGYPSISLIIDPVMIAKGGAPLLQREAIRALKDELLPMASIITPNLPEAEILAERKIDSEADIEKAGEAILNMGVDAVVMKGGHLDNKDYAEDLFMSANGKKCILRSKRIDTKDTHGTGCTFSAAMTASVAKGKGIEEAVMDAKYYIYAAIKDGLKLGKGHGPTNHWAHRLQGEESRKEVVLLD